MSMHIKKDDKVIVISGNDKGKQGKVVEVSPKEGKVIVEGVHVVSKHVKPRKMGEPGGIIKTEGAIYASKVMLVCPKCGKATRRSSRVLKDGTKARHCTACGELF